MLFLYKIAYGLILTKAAFTESKNGNIEKYFQNLK